MTIARSTREAIHDRFVFPMRLEKLIQVLDSLIPAAATILDVGCGNGLISSRLQGLSPGRSFTGIDIFARKTCMIPCTVYDGKTIPFGANEFDYLMFVDVLHHTTNAEDLLLQASRIARRGIILKDHYCESRLDHYTLAFMDWVGNPQQEVPLPHTYNSIMKWNAMFARAGLRQARTIDHLGMYPPPFDAIFGRKLHFVSLLERV